MKIALLTDGIYPYVIGGMQKHSFYLAKYLAQHGISVDLYHTAIDIEKAREINCFTDEEKIHIRSFIIPFPKAGKLPGHYIRESYSYSAAIAEVLKKNSPVDFIYVQGLCGMKLLEIKTEFKAPVGVNFHGLEMFQKAADVKSRLDQYLFIQPVLRSMRRADIVFSLGGKLTEIIESKGIKKEKIIRIPIAIDASWLRTEPLTVNLKRRFIFVGRYERRKGIEELTNVLRMLLSRNDFEFQFIGAIPLEKQLKSENIKYWGSISDVEKIKEIVSEADVLVCPSYSEGMPTVILEAMASGLAVIASDVGAVSEQVSSKNGKLITPGNEIELKNSMIDFIEMSTEDLLAMKQGSIELLKKKFLWNAIILSTIEEIRKVIEK